MIAPQGIANLSALTEIIEDDNVGLELVVAETARLYLEQVGVLNYRISSLEKALKSEAKQSENCARKMSMPTLRPITAMAIEAFAPTMTTFWKGRDFAAWFGLVQDIIRAVERRCWAGHRRWDSATSGGF